MKRLIRLKVYIDRGRGYIGYVQFIVTITIMLKVYEFGEWFLSRWWALLGFVVLFFVGLACVGYLDKRYIRPHEQSEMNSTNPEISEILKEVKALKK